MTPTTPRHHPIPNATRALLAINIATDFAVHLPDAVAIVDRVAAAVLDHQQRTHLPEQGT